MSLRAGRGTAAEPGALVAFHFRFIPFPEELNRYMLTITDLPERGSRCEPAVAWWEWERCGCEG